MGTLDSAYHTVDIIRISKLNINLNKSVTVPDYDFFVQLRIIVKPCASGIYIIDIKLHPKPTLK